MAIENFIILAGYLLGAIPFSYIIGYLFKGIDIRRYGTKNAGTSNVFLVVGTFPAILAMIGDIAKGSIAVLLPLWLGMPYYVAILAGIFAIIGHCYPIFLGFKGGKGMATAFGVLIPLAPLEILIAIAILVVLAFTIKKLFVSAIIAVSLIPLMAWQFGKPGVIIFGVTVIVLSRWIIDARLLKDSWAGKDYKKFIGKFAKKRR